MSLKAAKTVLNDQKGAALLISLSIISILFVVSLELNRRVRQNTQIAGSLNTEAKLMELEDIYPKTKNDLTFEKKVYEWQRKLSEILVAPFNRTTWSKM